MWKSSLQVAAVETLAYVLLAIGAMMEAGSGSGVVLILVPIIWLFLAFRLWIALKITRGVAASSPTQFMVVAAAVGLVSSIFLAVVMGGTTSSWTGYGVVPISILAHVAAAWFSRRA